MWFDDCCLPNWVNAIMKNDRTVSGCNATQGNTVQYFTNRFINWDWLSGCITIKTSVPITLFYAISWSWCLWWPWCQFQKAKDLCSRLFLALVYWSVPARRWIYPAPSAASNIRTGPPMIPSFKKKKKFFFFHQSQPFVCVCVCVCS